MEKDGATLENTELYKLMLYRKGKKSLSTKIHNCQASQSKWGKIVHKIMEKLDQKQV